MSWGPYALVQCTAVNTVLDFYSPYLKQMPENIFFMHHILETCCSFVRQRQSDW